jgi:hypothetical protein
MSHRVVTAFEVTSWEQATYDEPAEGPALARATVTKSFSGDLEGTSVAELLLCQPDDQNAGYVASERVTGTLAGRSGAFVMQHGGTIDAGQPEPFGYIVPGSGTGALTGLRGTVRFRHDETGATITIDYTLLE